ncbi:hypothetical protein F3Y22_tig00111136pilonHSYRG00003 [Hibiscus syriacus]|uniref:Uncharacterized protein n=1 Tax=Hibiscus syriacus TaxID=106335 RepID=A0A6A2YYJ7_HIBSY|nr:hypothetical protein F3Y22_tig00111136pilonHSYRG00003 [Hibiscus syriacus]
MDTSGVYPGSSSAHQLVIFFLFICHSLSFPLNSSMASHEETYALELIRQHLLADFASMEPQKPSSSLSQRRPSINVTIPPQPKQLTVYVARERQRKGFQVPETSPASTETSPVLFGRTLPPWHIPGTYPGRLRIVPVPGTFRVLETPFLCRPRAT